MVVRRQAKQVNDFALRGERAPRGQDRDDLLYVGAGHGEAALPVERVAQHIGMQAEHPR
jgi:hypothetical protein